MQKWFQRLANVPRVNYTGSAEVNRTQLPGHNAKPEIHRFHYEGKHQESLMWPTRDGSTSASPAQQWETKPRKGENPGQTALRQLYEALELPGEIADYHFLIQSCCDKLWSYRREQQWVYPVVETLSWLDIRLVEAYPHIIQNEYRVEGEHYYQVIAFSRLTTLYLREGFVREAFELAQRAARLGNCTEEQLEAYRERVATLEHEGAKR